METILLYVLLGVVAAGVGRLAWNWWFKRDEEREDQQRRFAALAAQLKALNPDSWFARFFDDLAFDDYSDLIEEVYEFAALVEGDPQVLLAEFDKQFFNLLSSKVKNPAQLALIQARIAEATQPAAAA